MEAVKDAGLLFYLVSPNETTFERLEHLPKPDYVSKAVPYFFTFIAIEYVIQLIKQKRTTRLNDGIISVSHGMYLGCQMIIFRGMEHYVYIKIYENYRLVDLPWDSPWTWYLAALIVDFTYYWLHRAAHEINIFWALHQVHHSSEDYNLTTALRQSAFQGWFAWVFYVPFAFFLPPTSCLVHQQLNLVYQFWIHTNIVDHIGPLEYILNTPRHHRIHHGSNRYCLDKNYAGFLIIWDRMFGTFEEEKPNEEIVYGLVEDVRSFNSLWLQIFYFPKIWNRMKEYSSITDKLSVLFKGPGWTPGTPRLGDINGVPLYPVRERYDMVISLWKNIYVFLHFTLLLVGFHLITLHQSEFSQVIIICIVTYIMFSLTSIGFILEDLALSSYFEVSRCLVALGTLYAISGKKDSVVSALQVLYALSAAVWFMLLIKSFAKSSKSKVT